MSKISSQPIGFLYQANVNSSLTLTESNSRPISSGRSSSSKNGYKPNTPASPLKKRGTSPSLLANTLLLRGEYRSEEIRSRRKLNASRNVKISNLIIPELNQDTSSSSPPIPTPEESTLLSLLNYPGSNISPFSSSSPYLINNTNNTSEEGEEEGKEDDSTISASTSSPLSSSSETPMHQLRQSRYQRFQKRNNSFTSPSSQKPFNNYNTSPNTLSMRASALRQPFAFSSTTIVAEGKTRDQITQEAMLLDAICIDIDGNITLICKDRTLWVRDEVRPICTNCLCTFNLFNRRHHCRACGEVFCSVCSNKFELMIEIPPVTCATEVIHASIYLPKDVKSNKLRSCRKCESKLSLWRKKIDQLIGITSSIKQNGITIGGKSTLNKKLVYTKIGGKM